MLLFFTSIAKYIILFLDKFYLFTRKMTKKIANKCCLYQIAWRTGEGGKGGIHRSENEDAL